MNKNKVLLPKWIVVLLSAIIVLQGFFLLKPYLPNATSNNSIEIQDNNKQVNLGYLNITPVNIPTSGQVNLEYGYTDRTNNEHLQSAITTVEVITPNKTKYTAVSGKVYPDDFPGAATTETGVYQVQVKRTIITTDGREDELYSAFATFKVSPN